MFVSSISINIILLNLLFLHYSHSHNTHIRFAHFLQLNKSVTLIFPFICLFCSNSINDLAASVTIAREGFPSMAVAGAYAGPMFNVLAGELCGLFCFVL